MNERAGAGGGGRMDGRRGRMTGAREGRCAGGGQGENEEKMNGVV